jgi:hypothetical protein
MPHKMALMVLPTSQSFKLANGFLFYKNAKTIPTSSQTASKRAKASAVPSATRRRVQSNQIALLFLKKAPTPFQLRPRRPALDNTTVMWYCCFRRFNMKTPDRKNYFGLRVVVETTNNGYIIEHPENSEPVVKITDSGKFMITFEIARNPRLVNEKVFETKVLVLDVANSIDFRKVKI